MPEFITFWIVFPAGVFIGSILHECGHWAAAVALRCEPRVVCFGQGRQIGQVRALGVHLVLRAVPLGGHVMLVPMEHKRRNARAAFIAAGVAANLGALLAALAAFWAWGGVDTVVDTALLAFAGAQAIGVLEFLLAEVEGLSGQSDREKLIAWATGRDDDILEKAYAPLVARLEPERRPARTRDFAEVLFHTLRPDREEPWGRQQAMDGIRSVLARGQLNQIEHIATQKRLMIYLEKELEYLASQPAEVAERTDAPSG